MFTSNLVLYVAHILVHFVEDITMRLYGITWGRRVISSPVFPGAEGVPGVQDFQC